MNQNAEVLTVLTGFIIPLVVGLLTKTTAPAALKAIMNAGLSGLASILSTAQLDHWSWRGFVIAWGSTWAVSIASYYGLLKPTGAAPAIQNATARFGLGRSDSVARLH